MKSNTGKLSSLLKYAHEHVSVHSVVTKFQGFFKVKEYTLQHKLFSGEQSQIFTREIFERGDAVVVIPYDAKQDKVLLIEQFRMGAININALTNDKITKQKNNATNANTTCEEDSPWLLEFIAGMFDGNESPIDVAIREAKEETNLTLSEGDLVPVMQFLPSPGGTSERIHLYLAHVDSDQINSGVTYGLPEENEDILLHLVSRVEALDLLSQGKITNAATIIGLQWLALNYQSL